MNGIGVLVLISMFFSVVALVDIIPSNNNQEQENTNNGLRTPINEKTPIQGFI